MGGFHMWKLLLIVVVVLFIFGGRRLPELGRGLGAGIANFRKEIKDPLDKDEDKEADSNSDKQ